ncbi:MAG: phosphotransferase family protein [Bacteroidia bacterium]|nr:phosphotransferase family protein [Bacteroidia bacterium]
MDNPKNIRPGEALDWPSLETYMRNQMPALSGAMTVAQFHGGHANLTYLIKFGDTELVLRRPPFGKIAPGAHDMKREYRVLSKLYKHFPRSPRAYLFCDDTDIIGAPFVVVERRTGIVVRYAVPEVFRTFDNIEERLTDALVKAIGDLHLVNVDAAGLSNLGRPEGYLERQLEGWYKRWELSKTEDNSSMSATYHILSGEVPRAQAVSIVHNDIKFDNCQFQPDNPDTVTSLFDWDMTTLGDPLADLGSTLSYWPEPLLAKYKNLPVVLKGAFPDKQYIKAKYAAYTGFDLSPMPWYEAFAYWKGAVIAQQLYKRYIDGATRDERMKSFGSSAKALAEMAFHIIKLM